MDWIELGNRLLQLRNATGMSQREAAKKSKLSYQIWDFLERAQRQNALVSTLSAMAEAVGAELVVEFRAKTDPAPLMIHDLSPEEQQLIAEVVEGIRTVDPVQRRIALRQLSRWVEDFGTVQQTQAIVEELPTVASRPRRGEEEKPALVAGAARPVVRRQPA